MFCRQDEFITIGRQELYEKLWATPTTILARGYGISDVALAKICKKHKIPKPSLGYWARVAVGKKVVSKPLLPIADLQLQQIRIRKRPERVEERLGPEATTALAAERAEAKIHVPPQLESPHPLIERTLKSLQSAAKNEFGLVRPKAKQCLDIAVSGHNIDRAVLVMDALVKAMERRGYAVSVIDEEHARHTTVTVLDESVPIQLKELLDHKEKAMTSKEREDYLRWHSRPKIEYFPSGRLALCIVSEDMEGCRRIWADGTTQKVEDRLNSFMGGLLTAAEAMKVARAKREQREREWKEAELRRHEAEQRRWEEEKRIRDLDAQVTSWEKSQRIRRFLDAVEAIRTPKGGTIDPSSQLGGWLVWARRYADSLDPIM